MIKCTSIGTLNLNDTFEEVKRKNSLLPSFYKLIYEDDAKLIYEFTMRDVNLILIYEKI